MKILCKLWIHQSDKDYGIRWHDKAVVSICKHCGKQLVHRSMFWSGGGNL